MKKVVLILLFSSFMVAETISVIIPCYHGHFQHLEQCLTSYENQTRKADEIIIALSSAHLVPEKDKAQLISSHPSLPLSLIQTNEVKYAGENRNIGSSAAHGSIFVYQDADDLAHPQRLEFIERLFIERDVKCIMHKWVCETEYTPFHFDKLEWKYLRWFNPRTAYENLHFGANAIRREVFSRIQWPGNYTGQDYFFNWGVYIKFKKTIVINAGLYFYRNELSSHKGENN